jgi:hypothetical protein
MEILSDRHPAVKRRHVSICIFDSSAYYVVSDGARDMGTLPGRSHPSNDRAPSTALSMHSCDTARLGKAWK